eukprot:CAMPEP_0196732926 /NCGR_PEP_ID=MMETSP1091-20130531/12170_1 /TAXON_ID=302021 /ORGANISM="Rhodomonas sp., Strain CCMP768" /LENGTH=878 /DNA_ID=CAMNT_0042076261 /DNA_START=39 /DNA_END=2676 /DNA_ORIENTATION=-
MSDSGQALKVSFRGELRRFIVAKLDYDAVLVECAERFLVHPTAVKLVYVDCDGDDITVASSEELEEAVRVQNSTNGAVLRLTLVPTNEPPATFVDGCAENQKESIAAIVAELLRKHTADTGARREQEPSITRLLPLLEMAISRCDGRLLQALMERTPSELEQKLLEHPNAANLIARGLAVLCDLKGGRCKHGENPQPTPKLQGMRAEAFPFSMGQEEEAMSMGSSGVEVLGLQQNLAVLGYLHRGPRFWTVRGGVFEALTLDAVAAFQRDHALPPGPVDGPTKLALTKAVEAAKERRRAAEAGGEEAMTGLIPAAEEVCGVPAAPLCADDVLALHRALAFAGYLTPRRPQFWQAKASVQGPWTVQALSHFQRDSGMAAGEYCEATKARLAARVEAVRVTGERGTLSEMAPHEAEIFPPFATNHRHHHRHHRCGRGPRRCHHHVGRAMREAGVTPQRGPVAFAPEEVPPVPSVDLAEGATGAEVVALHQNLSLVGVLSRPLRFYLHGKAAVYGHYTAEALRAVDASLPGTVFDGAAREVLTRHVDKVRAERQSCSLTSIPLGPWLAAPPVTAAAVAGEQPLALSLPAAGDLGAMSAENLSRNLRAVGYMGGQSKGKSKSSDERLDVAAGIRELQAGAGLDVTGDYDNQTRAVLALQLEKARTANPGLGGRRGGQGPRRVRVATTTTGAAASMATWEDAEEAVLCAVDLQRGAEGAAVRALQRVLAMTGYLVKPHKFWAKPPRFGGQTELAVKRFQEARGLAVTGVVSAEVRAALQADAERTKNEEMTTTTTTEGEDETKGGQSTTDDEGFVRITTKTEIAGAEALRARDGLPKLVATMEGSLPLHKPTGLSMSLHAVSKQRLQATWSRKASISPVIVSL